MSLVRSSGTALQRRSFLKSSSALVMLGLAGGSTPFAFAGRAQAAEVEGTDKFLAFSQFVTGLKLDPRLASRYLQALTETDPTFTPALNTAINATAPFQAQGIDAMLKTLQPTSPVYRTIKTVTSAWYLGVVGEGSAARLIAFYDALMFQPTREYVFVPTYGGGPNSWVSETHPWPSHEFQD